MRKFDMGYLAKIGNKKVLDIRTFVPYNKNKQMFEY